VEPKFIYADPESSGTRGYRYAQGVQSRHGVTIGRLEIQRSFARAAKTLPAYGAGGFGKLKPTLTFAQDGGSMAIELPRHLSLLFFLVVFPFVPTEDSWVGHSGFPVSTALAGLAGSRISAPQRASARGVLACPIFGTSSCLRLFLVVASSREDDGRFARVIGRERGGHQIGARYNDLSSFSYATDGIPNLRHRAKTPPTERSIWFP
jgi:hypothetical protein